MSRSLPEWIGKTDDTPVPPRVRQRVFDAHDGRCALSGRKIHPGDKWEVDHRIALANGGENRETNLQPVLIAPHRVKTAQDVAEKARDRRKRQKHLGLHRPKRKLPGSRDSGWKAKIGGGWERRQ